MALARWQAACLQMRTGRQHGPDRTYMYAQLDLKPNLSNESVSLDMQSMRVRTGICVRGARSGWPTSTRAYGGAGERQCTAARAWWREGDSGGNTRTHNTEKGLLAGVHASETAPRREEREGAQGGKVGVYVRWVGMRAKAARLGEGGGAGARKRAQSGLRSGIERKSGTSTSWSTRAEIQSWTVGPPCSPGRPPGHQVFSWPPDSLDSGTRPPQASLWTGHAGLLSEAPGRLPRPVPPCPVASIRAGPSQAGPSKAALALTGQGTWAAGAWAAAEFQAPHQQWRLARGWPLARRPSFSYAHNFYGCFLFA